MVVHMSWNGATDVAAWRVLAGERPGRLRPQTTIRTTGFESSTILPGKFAYAAVQALGSGGQVLSTSRTVAVESYAVADPRGRR
jgi:hypothetical protein